MSAKVGIVVPRSAAGREFALVAAGGHDARRRRAGGKGGEETH